MAKREIFTHTFYIQPYLFLFGLIGFILLQTPSFAQESQAVDYQNKIIMGVYAHPDDETSIGPVFAKYVRQGARVILVIATDGRLGTTDLTDLEAGDELASLRRYEMQCAADVLGAELIHLRYHDQLRMPEGQDEFIQESRRILDDLHEIMGEIEPDIIITFGPDGGSNHLDHRILSVSTTQVVLSKKWGKKPSLFYSGIPVSEADELWRYRAVHEDFLTVREKFTDEDIEVAAESARCHASQFSPEFVDARTNIWRERGTAWFRPFEAPRNTSESLLSYPPQYR